MLAKFGLYDFSANVIPGIFILWALGTVLELPRFKETVPLAGGLGETSVLVVVGYVAGILLQGVSQTVTERVVKWWWRGFPSERWLLPEDSSLTTEYKDQLNDAIDRRFGLRLEAAPPRENNRQVRKKRLKRSQEVFYRCYRSVEKSSELPQTFNAQYGLFRALLTTFWLLAIISLGLITLQWYRGIPPVYRHVVIVAISIMGATISYGRMTKRGEDFAKSVLDVFLVNNPPPRTG